MRIEFDKTIVVEGFEVQVDTAKNYGYFEWIGGTNEDDDEIAGGLWFEDGALTDYDGVFELPPEVIKGLKELGFNMDAI